MIWIQMSDNWDAKYNATTTQVRRRSLMTTYYTKK